MGGKEEIGWRNKETGTAKERIKRQAWEVD